MNFQFEKPKKRGVIETARQGTPKAGRKPKPIEEKLTEPSTTYLTKTKKKLFKKTCDGRKESYIQAKLIDLYIQNPDILNMLKKK